MKLYKVCIDPGHGGNDRANRGQMGYVEADGMLILSKFLRDELLSTGRFDVLLTRDKDMTLGLTERAIIASSFNADLFISQHTNATGRIENTTVRGAEVYYSINRPNNSQFAFELSSAISSLLSVPNRGEKTRESERFPGRDYYTVINASESRGIPSILLVESDFHDHLEGEKILKQDKWLKKIAKVQAKVICRRFGVEYNSADNIDIDIEIKKPVLKFGMFNSLDVKVLQQSLNDLGYNIEVDGHFGSITENTVKDFQKTHNLLVDGIVGSATWKAIEEALANEELKEIEDDKIEDIEQNPVDESEQVEEKDNTQTKNKSLKQLIIKILKMIIDWLESN